MTDKPRGSGASLRDRATRASPQAAARLDHPASIPCAVADKLREARALIERGWTQGEYARGKSGKRVDERGKDAVCYCALGAIRHVDYWAEYTLAGPLLRATGALSLGYLIDFNDKPGRTQAEVLAAFDKAIELAEAQS